jgi:hypothetical protein
MSKFISQLWTNEKGKRFVVLPEEEFIRLSELIEDCGLSRIFKKAKESGTTEPSIPFAEVRRQLAARRHGVGKKRGF